MTEFSKNPTLDEGIYMCDVEAHTFGDRLYLYGTCNKRRFGEATDPDGEAVFHVFSTDDMIHFTDHGVAFSSDKVKWIKTSALWAPDCAYYNGKYYLYYSIPTGEMGVAVSDKPAGPFEDLGKVKGVSGIDPAVLVDDDGTPYLYWGQIDFVRAAKLKPSMTEIDEETVTQPLSVAEHGMHEGSSVRKKDGKYYYVYTETGRRDMPTCQGHSVSDSPLTGYKYSGVVVDVFGCDPKSYNNHGSIECFKGQWYIFYHRATHGIYSWGQPRQLCIEKIFFDEEGRIIEALPTSSGAGDAIPASEAVHASYTAEIGGGAYNDECGDKHYLALSRINPGAYATYRYLDFNGEDTVTLRLRGEGISRVELYVDGKYHTFAKVELPIFFDEKTFSLPALSGRHEITFKFYGHFSDADLSEFTFSKSN